MNSPASDPVTPESSASAVAAATGWKKVTRALARRATDLLAIAIVAVGVLSISGRLAEWWSTDVEDLLNTSRSASQVAGTQTTWGADGEAVLLRLGQLAVSVERQVVRGDQAQADVVLLNACRMRLESSSTELAPSPDAAAEQKLLAGLAQLKPIEEQGGAWKLYRLDGADRPIVGTLVVGVRTSRELAVVACWGMAVPRDDQSWTVFTFDKTAQQVASSDELPLPPDATQVLSVADPQGGRLLAIEALAASDVEATLKSWRAFFGNEFAQRGWQTARPWTQSARGWSARYERATQRNQEAVELMLTIDGSGRVVGVLNWIVEPAAQQP